MISACTDSVEFTHLIIESKQQSDPMADNESTNKAGVVVIKDRAGAFQTANVPSVVDLALPSFVNFEGAIVPGISMRVFFQLRVLTHA